MSSSEQQKTTYVDQTINRRTVAAAIREHSITGSRPIDVAKCIQIKMGARPACRQKIQEIVEKLLAEHLAVINFGKIKLTTEKEQRSLREKHVNDQMRTRKVGKPAPRRRIAIRWTPINS